MSRRSPRRSRKSPQRNTQKWLRECTNLMRTDLVPPSSNPADIYRELQRDVQGMDSHSAKIAAQKVMFTSLAIEWEQRGEISSTHRDEIIYLVTHASFDL